MIFDALLMVANEILKVSSDLVVAFEVVLNELALRHEVGGHDGLEANVILIALKTITQLVEDMKVESPKEIKKKQLAKLTKAELLAMLVDDEPKVTKPKAKRKKKAKHNNGSLARKARKTRTPNQRLDDHATKTSLAKLEMKFDDALNRRLTGVINR